MTDYIVYLPKAKWYRCPSCHGRGQIYQERNCHESAGWVPCQRCRDGTIRTEYITKEEYETRREAGELYDQLGNNKVLREQEKSDMLRRQQALDFIQTLRDQVKVADRFSEDKALAASARDNWARVAATLRLILDSVGHPEVRT